MFSTDLNKTNGYMVHRFVPAAAVYTYRGCVYTAHERRSSLTIERVSVKGVFSFFRGIVYAEFCVLDSEHFLPALDYFFRLWYNLYCTIDVRSFFNEYF